MNRARAQSCSRTRRAARAGLSLIEMMIALTISVTLLTSALVALDGMFKGYQQTTESASTHVVSRIVTTRLLGMIRTGSDFGPIPNDILDSGSNPIFADYFEFASAKDGAAPETPSVTLLDLLFAYDTGNWRYALNVNNATDKEYVSTCLSRGDCWFGARRSVIASATYRF